MDAHDASASNFPPPLSPTTPITPYNPPNSPLKQINCLRPPRQNGATTATTRNDNQMFRKGSFPLQPSISKSYTVSQQSKPLPASAVRLLLAEYRQTVHLPSTLRHPLSSGAPRRPGDLQRQRHLACKGQQYLTCHHLRLFHMEN